LPSGFREALGLRDANEGFNALETVHGRTVLREPGVAARSKDRHHCV